jgi:uncharacterized repeat protein (TIGR01451 family)
VVAWVTHDYDGNPYSAPPSVGAFEGNLVVEGLSKAASTTDARYGERITYTITIADLSAAPTATHVLTDRVPTGLSYVPDSLAASGGTVDEAGAPLLRWTGLLTPTPGVSVTYAVTVSTRVPQRATNTAVVGAPGYQGITRTATVRLNAMRVYLPLTLRSWVW